MEPHGFWQDLRRDAPPAAPFGAVYPGTLADGWLPCPVRVLPGDGTAAVASLILNQASFAVQDALAAGLVARLAPHAPEVVVSGTRLTGREGRLA